MTDQDIDRDTDRDTDEKDQAQDDEGFEGHGEAAAALEEEPPEDTKREIDEERERRLDPDNRPDGAEVDNTDRTFVVERGRFEDSDVDEELGPFRTEDEA